VAGIRKWRDARAMMKGLLVMLSALLPSCAYLPRATQVPVATSEKGVAESQELVVFLPGRWSTLREFEKEGFFEIAAEKWPSARLVAADLHLGYYKEQVMAKRLHEDIILPAKRSGVTKVRLVGISMGGMGAVVYALEHPGMVDEMILLSPFLGEDVVIQEIQAAGGLEKWKPGEIEPEDFSRKLWSGLETGWRGERPAIFLGCGTEDRLASASRLYAKEFLTKDQQLWISGGHDWEAWRELFRRAK